MNEGDEPAPRDPRNLVARADPIEREPATRRPKAGGGEHPLHAPPGEQPAGPLPAPGAGDQPGAPVQPTVSYGACARAIVTARARIENYLDPALFSDPAFDILLDLLASEEEGRKVSMSSCAYAARVARTTGLRWVGLLEDKGLVERVADDEDQRMTLVRLTDDARASLIRYLQQVVQPLLRR